MKIINKTNYNITTLGGSIISPNEIFSFPNFQQYERSFHSQEGSVIIRRYFKEPKIQTFGKLLAKLEGESLIIYT